MLQVRDRGLCAIGCAPITADCGWRLLTLGALALWSVAFSAPNRHPLRRKMLQGQIARRDLARAGRIWPNLFDVRLDRNTATPGAGRLYLGNQIRHGRMIPIFRTAL